MTLYYFSRLELNEHMEAVNTIEAMDDSKKQAKKL